MYGPPHIKSKVIMKLENNVLYWSKLENVSVGSLTLPQLLKHFGSGRQAGVLLEPEIANKFEECVESEKQGAGPDIIRGGIDKIQAKTFRVPADGVFKSGSRIGTDRWDKKDIFTTKSGIWDKAVGKMKDAERKQWEEIDKPNEIEKYWNDYDTFMYVDIDDMEKDFSYSFLSVPTESVKATHEDGHISYNDIRGWIKDEKWNV